MIYFLRKDDKTTHVALNEAVLTLNVSISLRQLTQIFSWKISFLVNHTNAKRGYNSKGSYTQTNV